MNYFIFDYTTHSHLIDSFLESAFQAHKHLVVKTKDWFYWKFKDNPYGEAILACAIDNEKIIGCVALGVSKKLEASKSKLTLINRLQVMKNSEE